MNVSDPSEVLPVPAQLTSGELGAICAYFDYDDSGTVDVPEFLSQFFRLSITAKGMLGGAGERALTSQDL
jgi:hypothetical protein